MGAQREGFGFFFGLLVGSLIGASVAIILAPQSGDETRELIRDRAEKAKEKASDFAQDLKEDSKELLERAKAKRNKLAEGNGEATESGTPEALEADASSGDKDTADAEPA
jgi:gas vesicle protein